MVRTRHTSLIGTALLTLAAAAADGNGPPSSEVLNLGLRGVYFVENQGQWGDESVHYGLKSRGLDVAFRESSFTMHLAREVSADVPVAVARGAWASRPYESELVEWASRPYESELAEWASRPFDPPIAPEASPTRERGLLAFDDPTPLPDGRGSLHAPVEHEHLTLTITFPGSNPVAPRGAQPQAAKFNYFVGGEGRGTASNVPSFAAVVYENLYDGIDLFVCGNDDGVMKYEFHCAPGADYTQIRIHYDGIDSLCVNDEGDLEIVTSFGTLRDGAPIVWQEDAGAQHDAPAPRAGPCRPDEPTIPARFEPFDAATYRIAFDGSVDPMRELVIDPDVAWMVYLGGGASDGAESLLIDEQSGVYLAGHTWSRDFRTQRNSFHGGNFDAYLCHADAQGELQWMTYLGGGGDEVATCTARNDSGQIFIVGWTSSSDFEGRSNSYGGKGSDGYLATLDTNGVLQWMLYLGGDGFDYGTCLNCERPDEVLVSGGTDSTNFPGAVNAPQGGLDAFIVCAGIEGGIRWMQYYGGTRYDIGYAMAIDINGDLHLTGHTNSPDFAGRENDHRGAFDGYLARTNALGEILSMRYFGGSGDDRGRSLARDARGGSTCTGRTNSSDFEGRINEYHGNQDVFVIHFSRLGTVEWMTYVGGSEDDNASQSVCLHSSGQIMLVGDTQSDDMPEAINDSSGESDAFLATLNEQGVILWSRYLGGGDDDSASGLLIAPDDSVFICGWTRSQDFEGRTNEHHGGSSDAFLVRLVSGVIRRLAVRATCPSGGPIRIEWSGASPGGQVALIYARNTGSFEIPNNFPCAGTQLGLGSNQIQLAWQGGAGQNGSRTLNTTAGPGACGGYLQLLDLTTCGTSNVARVE